MTVIYPVGDPVKAPIFSFQAGERLEVNLETDGSEILAITSAAGLLENEAGQVVTLDEFHDAGGVVDVSVVSGKLHLTIIGPAPSRVSAQTEYRLFWSIVTGEVLPR